MKKVVLTLTALLFSATSALAFNNASLSGSYALTGPGLASIMNGQFGGINMGTWTFDGAGNFSGPEKAILNYGDPSFQTLTCAFSAYGVYAVKPDGSGTIRINFRPAPDATGPCVGPGTVKGLLELASPKKAYIGWFSGASSGFDTLEFQEQ